MCGIAGYVELTAPKASYLLPSNSLRYRGYDSAGIAITNGEKISTGKTAGRIRGPQRGPSVKSPYTVALWHCPYTLGCTLVKPTTVNAHPHLDEAEQIAVHNGIIENHDKLQPELEKSGVVFKSETDTEVLPHLLASAYKKHDAFAAFA